MNGAGARGVVRICALAALAVACGLALAACGGSSKPAATDWRSLPFRPNPVDLNGDDPDTGAESASDISTTLTSLGGGRFELTVENESPLGTVNSFSWAPPPHELRITSIVGSSGGHCSLTGRTVTCEATLLAPKCTCRPGGSITIRFRGVQPKEPAKTTGGLEYGTLVVGRLTPVPYIIPSSSSEQPPGSADLPFCGQGRHSTRAHRCIETGG